MHMRRLSAIKVNLELEDHSPLHILLKPNMGNVNLLTTHVTCKMGSFMTRATYFNVLYLYFISELYYLIRVCWATSPTHFSRFSQGSTNSYGVHSPKSCGVIYDPNENGWFFNTLVMTFFLKNQFLINS